MNTQWLLMKYHPAKKEVEFHRFQNDKEIPIRDDSKLRQYMNKKGKFVLQDHGNAFFDDIAKAFDGLKSVEIRVITTKMDYEDFEQMVEYYNEEANNCKFTTTLLAELPDMAQTFAEVKKFGENAIQILNAHKQKLFEIPLDNDDVKRSAESFSGQLDTEVKNIREKIESLADNHVSLCFTGVYSAGKSSLINALLGYRILPEAVKSETAKMFKIFSPQNGETVKISFLIKNVYSVLEWNESAKVFEFAKGPSESDIVTEIQNVVNEEKGKFQHDQIRAILSSLNTMAEISPDITIVFPVSLDTNAVQFTIYDTPGSDSNYLEHQTVLNDALAEQTQSILVFVVHPTKLEGAGNNALLNYLKAAEEKSSKTSIDIGRSLFVVNYSDTIKASDREQLRYSEIKNKDDESFSIKLADKKLLFATAKFGYISKAVKNNIATDDETWDFDDNCNGIISKSTKNPNGPCFRQNHCATSERATSLMISRCEEALIEAENNDDKAERLHISSGLFAIEAEIRNYGEKYAAAVKAYAIIHSVEEALKKLNNRADSLRRSNDKEIADIENDIKNLKETIDNAIIEAYNRILPPENALPEETKKELGVDKDTLSSSLIGDTLFQVKKQLKGWFFGHGHVHIHEKDKEKVRSIIQAQITDFTNKFFSSRKALLEAQRDEFMNEVKGAIERNGDISEEAKKWMTDIPKPEVKNPDKFKDIGQIYDSYKRSGKVLFFNTEHLDRDGFVDEIEERLGAVARSMSDDYCKDYRTALETMLAQIKSQYQMNLDDYSLNMKTLKENKAAMEQLGAKLVEAANELRSRQDGLNAIIWKEISNA